MPPKILLVDDVNMFLEIQKGFLRLSSVHVVTATNGAEALAAVRRERPSLVFLDLHMPGMRGDDCCAAIKSDPELRSVPVVMVTAEGKEDDRLRCERAGCDGFLTKPLERHLYLQTARRFLPAIDRRDGRAPCQIRAKFRAFGVTLSGDILDISAGGIYISADYDVSVGTILDVEFTLPDRPDTVVRAKGRVAWLNGRTGRKKPELAVGFGVELLDLSAISHVHLREYVAAKLLLSGRG